MNVCFLQSTISISSASGKVVYGGNTHGDKSCLPSWTWKEDAQKKSMLVRWKQREEKKKKSVGAIQPLLGGQTEVQLLSRPPPGFMRI